LRFVVIAIIDEREERDKGKDDGPFSVPRTQRSA